MSDLLDDIFKPSIAPGPVYFDRSTAERYARCPLQGFAVETGLVQDPSPAADAGQEAHAAIAFGLAEFAERGEFPVEEVEAELLKSRPDVQPVAVEGLRWSLWAIRSFLKHRNPADLLRYQGGQGPRSGQLARQMLPATGTTGPVIATAEVDMLLATSSAAELEDVDVKTGRAVWSAADVKDAFQFQMHNWLLRGMYESLERVSAVVWMTHERIRSRTSPVVFTAADATAFEGRLAMAWKARADALAAAKGTEDIEAVETWPARAKCVICPAISICPRANQPAADLNRDPARFAKDTEVVQISLVQRLRDLRAYVDAHGERLDEGYYFGHSGPRRVMKPKADSYRFYELGATPDNGEATDGPDEQS